MQCVKVDSPHVTIRRKGFQPGRWIAANYKPNYPRRIAEIISLSNPSSPYQTRFNLARRLLA